MKKICLVLSALCFAISGKSQITVTGYQSGFGVDVSNGIAGISTVTYNNEVANGGPMVNPKSLTNINSELIAIAGMYGGTTTDGGHVLNIKRKSDGSNYQEVLLNFTDIGSCKTTAMIFDNNTSRLYLVGFSGTNGVVLAYKWVVPLKGGNSTFILDNTFDSDGKLVIANSKVTSVCLKSSEIFVTVDKNSGVDVNRYGFTGGLLSTYTIPATGQSYRNALKITEYPGVSNSFVICGNEGNFPALWIVRLDMNNTFSLLASNSLNGIPEGTGSYRDFCFSYNSTTLKYDIVGVGTSTTGLSSYSGNGFYQKFKGISLSTGYVNLISDLSFTNSAGNIGNGVYANVPASNCSMRSIQRLSDGGYLIMGLNNLGNSNTNDDVLVNMAYLSSNGQVLTRVFVTPSWNHGHLGDEMLVENGVIYYASCAGQTILAKLNYF